MMQVSSLSFSLVPVQQRFNRSTAEAPRFSALPEQPSSARRSDGSFFQRFKKPLVALTAFLGLGGATTWVNMPPKNCVGTARESILGIPAPWPSAYINTSGEVIGPLTRIVSGHVTPDGQASGWVFSKGSATEDGYLYKPLSLGIPSGSVTEEGTVYRTLGLIPEGYVNAPTLSRQEKGAFALLAGLLDTSSSSSSSNKSGK